MKKFSIFFLILILVNLIFANIIDAEQNDFIFDDVEKNKVDFTNDLKNIHLKAKACKTIEQIDLKIDPYKYKEFQKSSILDIKKYNHSFLFGPIFLFNKENITQNNEWYKKMNGTILVDITSSYFWNNSFFYNFVLKTNLIDSAIKNIIKNKSLNTFFYQKKYLSFEGNIGFKYLDLMLSYKRNEKKIDEQKSSKTKIFKYGINTFFKILKFDNFISITFQNFENYYVHNESLNRDQDSEKDNYNFIINNKISKQIQVLQLNNIKNQKINLKFKLIINRNGGSTFELANLLPINITYFVIFVNPEYILQINDKLKIKIKLNICYDNSKSFGKSKIDPFAVYPGIDIKYNLNYNSLFYITTKNGYICKNYCDYLQECKNIKYKNKNYINLENERIKNITDRLNNEIGFKHIFNSSCKIYLGTQLHWYDKILLLIGDDIDDVKNIKNIHLISPFFKTDLNLINEKLKINLDTMFNVIINKDKIENIKTKKLTNISNINCTNFNLIFNFKKNHSIYSNLKYNLFMIENKNKHIFNVYVEYNWIFCEICMFFVKIKNIEALLNIFIKDNNNTFNQRINEYGDKKKHLKLCFGIKFLN